MLCFMVRPGAAAFGFEQPLLFVFESYLPDCSVEVGAADDDSAAAEAGDVSLVEESFGLSL